MSNPDPVEAELLFKRMMQKREIDELVRSSRRDWHQPLAACLAAVSIWLGSTHSSRITSMLLPIAIIGALLIDNFRTAKRLRRATRLLEQISSESGTIVRTPG